MTPPVFTAGTFIKQFPALAHIPQGSLEFAWNLGANWVRQDQVASWGLSYPAKLQQAADLMGAVIAAQLYGSGSDGRLAPNEAPGALAAATQGSVSTQFQLPEIGTSAFASMCLASPPYGRLLLALLQISASVGPYIPSCRPSSRVPP